ncbi:MAG: hypothetical protein R3B96_07040 [Pirellulaceae bacterium]
MPCIDPSRTSCPALARRAKRPRFFHGIVHLGIAAVCVGGCLSQAGCGGDSTPPTAPTPPNPEYVGESLGEASDQGSGEAEPELEEIDP